MIVQIYTKTFRLFLSSIFNDMRAEREILQEEVFPKLREYCNAKRFNFQAIDLRWGVSAEAGNDQKTIKRVFISTFYGIKILINVKLL